jgi:hypothetical protein
MAVVLLCSVQVMMIVGVASEMGKCVELRTTDPESGLYRVAQELGDSQSQYLGMLPFAAWQEYVEKG